MVLFELATAKGAAALSGCLKLAATGSTGAVVAIAGPPPIDDAAAVAVAGPPPIDDDAAVTVAGPGLEEQAPAAAAPAPEPEQIGLKISEELRQMMSWAERDAALMGKGDALAAAPWGPKPGTLSQVDFLPFSKMELVQAARTPVPEPFSTVGVLESQVSYLKASLVEVSRAFVEAAPSFPNIKTYFGVAVSTSLAWRGCEMLDKARQARQEDDSEQRSLMDAICDPCLRFVVLVDAMTVGAVISSIGVDLVAPLRCWAVGAVLLSLPATIYVDGVGRDQGFKVAFAHEAVLTGSSIFWLSFGTHMVSMYPELAHASPWLYYMAFSQCMLAWSAVSVSIVALIATSALSVSSNYARSD